MLYNTTRNVELATEVQVAFTFFSRLKGLMFRARLPAGQGLIMAPCRSVHMCFMRFPLDVVFVDRDYRVVGVEENLRPWRCSKIYRLAHFAIELPAGTVAQAETRTGDLLEFS